MPKERRDEPSLIICSVPVMDNPPVAEKSGGSSEQNVVASDKPEAEAQGGIEEREIAEESPSISDPALPQVSQDVDGFLSNLGLHDDKSDPPEVPDSVEVFCKLVETMIGNYDSGDNSARFGQVPEEDTIFLESVVRVSKLMNALRGFPVGSPAGEMYGRSGSVLQRAMSFVEDEFRTLLEDSRSHIPESNSLKTKHPSFNSKEDHDRCPLPESEPTGDEDYPAYPPEVVAGMKKVATAMISAGYETECCQVFSISRRNAFKEAVNKQGIDSFSNDDLQKMQWDTLEGEIAAWIKVVKKCSQVLFPGERRLAESVFEDHPAIISSQFSNLARAAVIHFLNFAEAVAMTKRSAEKLFKFLDMYETLRDLIPAISSSNSDDRCHELKSETMTAGSRLGEAAVSIFCDLENSIKSDVSKTPVPNGAVHPLTSYTMNYLNYACEYKDTMEEVFQQHQRIERNDETGSDAENDRSRQNNARPPPARLSPFATQLTTVMDLLDANMDTKSKLYKDMSLRYIFLMNNGRYILQKMKGSSEIHKVMGDTWCRKRSSDLRQYHQNYKRETWSKVLQCLKDEGLQVNGKVIKPVLKERFKTFNALFDEIHKTQSTWVVKDEQLRSELRVSISAVMIPAYRSFLARFSQYLDPGRQTEKYIKYQPEDIETTIDDLFDGNPMSMARKRT